MPSEPIREIVVSGFNPRQVLSFDPGSLREPG